MAPFTWFIFYSNKWLKTITQLCYQFSVAGLGRRERPSQSGDGDGSHAEWSGQWPQNEIVKFSNSARGKHCLLNDDDDDDNYCDCCDENTASMSCLWLVLVRAMSEPNTKAQHNSSNIGANHTSRPKARFSVGAACRQESYRIERPTKRCCFNVFRVVMYPVLLLHRIVCLCTTIIDMMSGIHSLFYNYT